MNRGYHPTSTLIHELSHAMVAVALNIRWKELGIGDYNNPYFSFTIFDIKMCIDPLFLGGWIKIDNYGYPMPHWKRCLISLAGPLSAAVTGIAIILFVYFLGMPHFSDLLDIFQQISLNGWHKLALFIDTKLILLTCALFSFTEAVLLMIPKFSSDAASFFGDLDRWLAEKR